MSVSRRKFIQSTSTLGALALAQQAFPQIASRNGRTDKPNVVFIWTDQQRFDTLAAYGNHRILAPNLNKLASDSAVFERSYVTQPICTPSRSSVMTGLWPTQTGCIDNNIPLSEDIPTQPKLLDDSDYRTGYFGKWHLGDEIFAQHGFEEWKAIEDLYIQYYREGRDSKARSSYHHFLEDSGFKPDLDRDGHAVFSRDFAARLPLEFSKPAFLRNEARDFIKRHKDDPFMLHVNFLEPHDPNWGPFNGYYPNDEVKLSDNWNDYPDATEPLRYHFLRLYAALDRGISEVDIRRETSRYWGLVTMVDMAVGGILGELEKWGLDENTIVVYTSDHGEMMGCHGMYFKGVMYEEAARVPCLIRYPKRGYAKRKISNPVSHIDLTPTVLDLAGVSEKAEALPGKSYSRYLNGTAEPESVFLQWHTHPSGRYNRLMDEGLISEKEAEKAVNVNTRTVVSPDGFKLCLSDKDKSQFYDLNKDPGETQNVYSKRDYAARVANMTKQLESWQESIEDPLEVQRS
ncbi:MAG: sulfatase-like hydrolase/transferase [Verrucomicrobia bacterium]|nr:sulfatase-like hydrolase/transferase [Verrucomicrobiota bacterium]